MKNFWQDLKNKSKLTSEPIMALAPMADVTDAAFRRIIAKYGKPDATWTEFVAADGLMRATPKGKKKLLRDLVYDESERPVVVQLFSSHPEYMYGAAKLVREMGFDGIDINMGCPDRSVEKQGAGAALMKNPRLAREVLRAAMEGVADGGEAIPVSVKTRIGYNKNELETWLPELLAEKPAMIVVHCRTRKEMSDVPARWEHVKRAVEIRDGMQKTLPEKERTLIFGNGDVADLDDARAKAKQTGADGVMMGRAVFGNPWLFNPKIKSFDVSTEQKLQVMLEHTKLFEELLGGVKSFSVMKKHFKAYANGFDGAVELREQLMKTENFEEVKKVTDELLASKKASI
jgi:nifR3 family TIM-barrel protein